MTIALHTTRPPLRIGLRRAEMAALWLALALQSGALFPMLAAASDGDLTAGARAMLRLLTLPVYAVTLTLAVRHHRQIIAAAQRSLPLLMLTALPVMSVVWSINPSLSLRRTVALVMSLLLSYVLAVRCTPRQLMWLIGSLLGLCMVGSLGLLVAAPHLAVPADGALRGIFLHKNVLGWAASLGALAGFAMTLDREGGFRARGAALATVSLVCLVLSRSGTGLMSMMVGLALIGFHRLLLRCRGMWRPLVLLLALAVAALVLLFLGAFLVPLLEALGKDATLTGRVPLWHQVDLRIAARPLLGYGYQALWSEASSIAWQIWYAIGWQAPHAHNGYREVLLNIGMLGGGMLAYVLVQALRRALHAHLSRPGDGWLWPNVLLGQVLFMNLTESTLMMQNDMQWIIVCAIVIMLACRRADAAAG
ncbi:O-antigen ligase family protein [Falsirhodobacter algicola]|uniref:O-antigen ligase family protein n=1 Tax=Falsirhodobacter algicola TaxID=2692330 RepID=A0A8J8MR27_9RHOB|nr:O-antigen ligase family protein [Falsirhodobacter algicola]QUS35116.1 O-antigen ligase family protein [Falsirhodobacter algicola]